MKVAIAGFGIEGKANYEYWHGLGHDVTIVDEKELNPYDLPYESASILGKDAFKKLHDFELVVRTASLAPSRIKTGGTVWSATNEFFAMCPAPIIGVTGTKGKGTTASLIASILRAAGHTVHLVGNIGVPALSVLDNIKKTDVVVFELSSFQLWDLKKSPHIAVVLMIEPDHLDIHKDLTDYVQAKGAIRRYQTASDVCIYHPTNPWSHQIAEATSIGKKIRYATPEDSGVYACENTFFVRNLAVAQVKSLQLVGTHNIDNACAAITAALQFGDVTSFIDEGLQAFTGLPHRLKLVRELEGVQYYDDSIATTPGSAIAALRAIAAPKLLILGGYDKGADYTELIALVKETGTHVLAIGTNRSKIVQLCKQYDVTYTELDTTSMKEIVEKAQGLAPERGAVILSPAAASFDMFKSYTDRGEQFVTAVEGL